jgi:hypothetical protein
VSELKFKNVSGYKAYISSTHNDLADLTLVYSYQDLKEVLEKVKAELKSYHDIKSELVITGRNLIGTPFGGYVIVICGVPIESAFALPDWTEECMAEERKQRETCDYCLYTITPSMQGVYSIAEVIDDSNKRPHKTVFCVLNAEIPINKYSYPNGKISFLAGEMRSLNQVGKMVERNGGKYFTNLKSVAEYLNTGVE